MNEATNISFDFNNTEYGLLKCLFWYQFVLPQNILKRAVIKTKIETINL